MRASLRHYWRSHLAVALGAATASAVLAGALVVGDSVRASLRGLVLDRLGSIESAVLAPGFFREELAEELAGVPMLTFRGAATRVASGARASNVAIFGVDASFAELFPEPSASPEPSVSKAPGDASLPFDFDRRPGQILASVVVNQTLADELGVELGDDVVVALERPAEIPRETVLGREAAAESVESLRLQVSAVVPDRGPGGFRFHPQQTAPKNLFVELSRLQRNLFGREQNRRANVALLPTSGSSAGNPDLTTRLEEAARLEDLSLFLETGEGRARLMSRQFVLSDAVVEEAAELGRERGLVAQRSLTYLANSLETAAGSVPYSTITALETLDSVEILAPLGTDPPSALADDEILIDAWSAEDLGAVPGETVRLTYYELGPRDELTERTAEFTLRGVVAMSGAAVDSSLTPDFPGMQDADDISAWEPPFPVDLDRVRDRDEDYWDSFEAAPKAFVSLAAGRELWRSRFGQTTALDLSGPAPEVGSNAAQPKLDRALARHLVRHLVRRTAPLENRDLRREGLEAARGATDFAGLFLALSFFLIVAAILLAALLFRLGLEQRAAEVGLLRAVGFREPAVRRRFLKEGLVVAAAGSALGLAAAVAYARMMLAGLSGWWRPAVGTSALELHVTTRSLALGGFVALVTVVFAIAWSLRRLKAVTVPALLSGDVERPASPRTSRLRRWIAVAALTGSAYFGLRAVAGSLSPALDALACGAGLLIAGIAGFSELAAGRGRRGWGPGGRRHDQAPQDGRFAAEAMGARNSRRHPGRSLASVALVATAVFLLVVVGANRRELAIDADSRDSGAGGFRWVAESSTPIYGDLSDPTALEELGLDAEDAGLVAAASIVPLRRLLGEDASCLNLYRPEKPTLLGVPSELVARGGFAFQSQLTAADNPWSLLETRFAPVDGEPVVAAIGDANSVQWILHSGLGKDFAIRNQRGQTVRLRFVALLKRSLFQSELLVAESAFLEHFPGAGGYGTFLVEAPRDDAPDFAEELPVVLERSLGRYGFDVTGSEAKILSFLAIENTYMATFQALGGLGLILGTLGLGIVLLRNVLERRGELATLRALGFRRSLLARMVLAENATLLAAGIGIGSIAGLIAVLPNLLAEGHGLPIVSLAATLAAVFTVGMLASGFAVRTTLRAPLIAALKGD